MATTPFRFAVTVLVIIAACVALPLASAQTDGYTISVPTGYQLLAKSNRSALYQIQDSNYSPLPYLLSLYGSRYQVGYDYGYLLADKIKATYDIFLRTSLPDEWERDAVAVFLDWQWDTYLSRQLPADYKEELKGLRDGGIAKNIADLDKYVTRVTTIANFPGDIEKDVEWLLIDELEEGADRIFTHAMANSVRGWLSRFIGQQCSYYAVWGSRTADGSLWTMRNLDWNPDTGVNINKLVTIFHVDNTIAHATFGFTGVYGALAGISAAGVTVHETGNDVRTETFRGFPWTFRLRYIMENSNNISQAINLWVNTNNTLGMNHMIASASDVKSTGVSHPAYALETMKAYTAYFQDNDPREAALTWYDKGQTYHLGFPLPEAVWRTNHAFDPTVVASQLEQTTIHSDSEIRYLILAQSFRNYERLGVKIDVNHAVNLTSILGAKNGENFYQCPDGPRGSNILSVTFHPARNGGTAYVAWDKGSGATWRPACCGTYLELDLSKWW